MSDTKKLQTAAAFVDILQGLKFARLAEVGQFLPQLELLEGGKKTAVAMGRAPSTLGEGVVFGVPRKRNHVAGKGHGLPYPADGGEVAAEPFVVVGVVVDLVGHDSILPHVGVVDAGGGFLTPGGGVVTLELGVDMAGHMPHVRDAGRGLPTDGSGIHRPGGSFVVPEVNAVVMSRVHGVHFEDPLEKGVDCFMALNLHTVAGVGPELISEQRSGLQVVGKLVKNLFKGLGVGFRPLGLFLLGRVDVLGQSFHVLNLLG